MVSRPHLVALAIAAAVLSGCAAKDPYPLTYSKPSFADTPQFQEAPEATAYAAPMPEPTPESIAAPVDQVIEPQTVWSPVEAPAPAPNLAEQYLALANSNSGTSQLSYLDQAASAGSGEAHYDLARVYTEGVKRPRDLDLAQQHLQAAAALDYPEATRVIGWQMIKGTGTNGQNVEGGVAIMEMAVTKSVRTQRELGMIYAGLYSDIKLNDPVKGEAYLLEAYTNGDVQAAQALGKFYIAQGRQIEAVAPLSFAADHKDTVAQKLLASLDGGSGPMLANAQLAPPAKSNDSERYYQRASSIMLRHHSADEEAKAYAMFSLAADDGHNLAKAELRAISGVKVLMDKKRGLGWLDEAKASVRSEDE